MKKRSLSLKREVLAELSNEELAGVNGGAQETLYSCMAFESCAVPFCRVDEDTLLNCIVQ